MTGGPPPVATADPPDEELPAHYGDPLREQRRMVAEGGTVERGNRPVVVVSGPDRLRWLHDITSQHLSDLAPGTGAEALVLSPHGHVEHHLVLLDDGERTYLDMEPGTAADLLRYLDAMRFLLRVETSDASAEWAVRTVVGPAAGELAGTPAPPPGQPYPVAALPGGGFARRMPDLGEGIPAVDLLVPRGAGPDLPAPAGLWAYEALRVQAARPRLHLDTDPRTIPHEVGWIPTAVHLDKGCYRGQETVARVHNLGRPPRRLVVLHLDGGTEALPARGSAVHWAERPVGFVGTSARHFELGPVALALVKRTVPADAEVLVETGPARLDPDLSLRLAEPAVPRDRVRPR